MGDDLERLNRLLDDLAMERDPGDRTSLSAAEVELAETAALLKAASSERSAPDEAFIARLGAQVAVAAHATDEQSATGDVAQARGVSRRGLLGRIATAAAGLAAGAGAADVLRGQVDQAAADEAYRRGVRDANSAPLHAPMVPNDRGSWVDLKRKAASVVPEHAVRFRVGAIEGFLVNPGNGKPIYAVSAACTHMGCMISWLDSTQTFLCPCHGAQYEPTGEVLSGIPRHPLPPLAVWTDKSGGLWVLAVGDHPANTTVVPYNAP